MAVRLANDAPEGFVMAGHTKTFDEISPAIFVMRTDGLGNPIWCHTYGRLPGRMFIEKLELKNCDSGYIICGTVLSSTEGGRVGFLLRIDDAGALLWMHIYQQTGVAFDSTDFKDVEQIPSGFIVTGHSKTQAPLGMFQNSQDTILLATDSAGVPVWGMQYPNLEGDNSGESLAVLSQGYAVVGGHLKFGLPHIELLTTDPGGGLIWYRRIATVMSGGSHYLGFVPNGTLHALTGGDLVFGGGGFDQNAALLRFDGAGSFVAGRSLGVVNWQYAAASVLEPAAAGYTFAGPTSNGFQNDYYLVRTDAAFSSGCHEGPLTPSVDVPLIAPVSIAFTTTPISGVIAHPPVVSPLVWTETILCQGSPCVDPVPITCSVSGLTVTIAWPPLLPAVASAELWRNGSLLAVVSGMTSHMDTPSLGLHTYELRLYDVNPLCDPAISGCSALVAFSLPVVNVTDVIAWPAKPVLDPVITCWEDALTSKGRVPVIDPSFRLIDQQLGSATGVRPVVWLSLGVFPEHHVLSPQEGQILADFLLAGGALYLEGSDVAFGNQTALAALDGVTAVADGDLVGEVPSLIGLDSGVGFDATNLSAAYLGRGYSIDHLQPDGPGAGPIFQNTGGAGQFTAVYHDAALAGSGTHRVITSSTTIHDYGGDRMLLASRLVDALSPPVTGFLRGDGNGDGAIDISDAIHSLTYLFSSGPAGCLEALDANDDGAVDIGDPIYSLAYLFAGGPPPAPPWPFCGSDPTPVALGCLVSPQCP